MRKLIALVASTAALLVASMANAAPVDVVFTQTAPGATTWTLSVNIPANVPVGAVSFHIVSSPAADFVISQPSTVIDPFAPTGFSVKILTGNDLHLSFVPAGANTTLAPIGPAQSFTIGTLTGAGIHGCNQSGGPTNSAGGCDGQFVPGDDDGGTILDDQFNPLDFTVRFVPEPGAVLLLGIGIAGLSLARRKA